MPSDRILLCAFVAATFLVITTLSSTRYDTHSHVALEKYAEALGELRAGYKELGDLHARQAAHYAEVATIWAEARANLAAIRAGLHLSRRSRNELL